VHLHYPPDTVLVVMLYYSMFSVIFSASKCGRAAARLSQRERMRDY
jgi:hypothetical protein